MMAAMPRSTSEVARLSRPAAVTAMKPPRMTTAILMYSSGRIASLMPFGKFRKDIGDDQAGYQRDHEAAFVGQFQRPADAEFLQVRRRDGGEMGVAADDPAGIGDPEHRRESRGEAPDVGPQRAAPAVSTASSAKYVTTKRAGAAERRIALGDAGASAVPGLVHTEVATTQPSSRCRRAPPATARTPAGRSRRRANLR